LFVEVYFLILSPTNSKSKEIMLGNFKYSNPTTLYFGKDALNALRDELKQYGPTIMLSYGGGSIKRNGIYDAVIEVLQTCGKHIVEDAGIMPNPTAESLAAVRSYRLPSSLHPFHRDAGKMFSKAVAING